MHHAISWICSFNACPFWPASKTWTLVTRERPHVWGTATTCSSSGSARSTCTQRRSKRSGQRYPQRRPVETMKWKRRIRYQKYRQNSCNSRLVIFPRIFDSMVEGFGRQFPLLGTMKEGWQALQDFLETATRHQQMNAHCTDQTLCLYRDIHEFFPPTAIHCKADQVLRELLNKES